MTSPPLFIFGFPHAFRRAGVWARVILGVCFFLSTMLGMLHAVSHPTLKHAAVAMQQLAVNPLSDVVTDSGSLAVVVPGVPGRNDSWIERLFGHQDVDRACLIFDQLCHGPAAPASAFLALSVALPLAGVLMFLEGETIARWAAFFDARGPPAHS